MPIVEQFLLHLFLWVVLPLLLIAVLAGPKRTKRFLERFWFNMTTSAQNPALVMERVVKEHEANIRSLKDVLRQAEGIQQEIAKNLRQCEEAMPALEKEAKELVAKGDDLGARAALSRLHLERRAAEGFRAQKAEEEARITQARRRLHLLELQLRQFELNRRILLNQLAEAKTVEQQYALANRFDPYNAVGAWMRTEGMVAEERDAARILDQLYAQTTDLPAGGQPALIDPEMVEADLARLKAEAGGKHTAE
jgi:phage shock protein A